MQAHVPDHGACSQLNVLASLIGQAIRQAKEVADAALEVDACRQISNRMDELAVLFTTYEVLSGNFEEASGAAIRAIAQLGYDGQIGGAVADELMAPFNEQLGEMYVDAIAAQ
mgnify:CR=1 FL=1